MSTADQLLCCIFSWVEKRRRCADHLDKLANELESYQKGGVGGQCVGSSVAVVGDACLIGSVLTGGAAAPFLGASGAAYTGTGIAISVVSKIVESFLSNKTLTEAKDVEEECNKCGQEIQRLYKRLKEEQMEKTKFSNSDKLDDCIMTEIMNSMARRSGLKWRFNYRTSGRTGISFSNRGVIFCHRRSLILPTVTMMCGVLGFFCLSAGGKKSGPLFSAGLQQLVKGVGVSAAKVGFSAAAKLVGGTVGLAFALPEAIDSWTQMIKNNHVTEASQSLRDTANAIRRMTKSLMEQLDQIRNYLQQIEEKENEEEVKLAHVKRCIKATNRSAADKSVLVNFAEEKCNDDYVQQWLRSQDNKEVYLDLLKLYLWVVQCVENRCEEKENKEDSIRAVDITFVAHGAIKDKTIPAFSLLPMSTIKDVLLYSPWNCIITAEAAYGIATGQLQPSQREFHCLKTKCRIDHNSSSSPQHVPTTLPNHWNSMRKSRSEIPNIEVGTLLQKEYALAAYLDLTERYGRNGRSRIVIPFWLKGKEVTLPFYVVTKVLALVLYVFEMRATVHLAACLGDQSQNKFDRNFLATQYSYTIDNTYMTPSINTPITTPTNTFNPRYPELYQTLRAIFRC